MFLIILANIFMKGNKLELLNNKGSFSAHNMMHDFCESLKSCSFLCSAYMC